MPQSFRWVGTLLPICVIVTTVTGQQPAPSADKPSTPIAEKPAEKPAVNPWDKVDPTPAWTLSDRDLVYSQVYPLITPRITLRTDVGDGVGYKRGFTYLEGFIPLNQDVPTDLWFANLRGINFDDIDRWEGQIGFGGRRYNAQRDRVLGVNAFYDVNNDGHFTFQQVGVGVESLGRYLDFRANGYCVLGPANERLSDTIGDPHFRNFFILFNHTQTYNSALSGFDAELGTPVPYLERWNVRAFGGMYCFANDNAPTMTGIRGRLEAQVTDRIALHFEVQNDSVNDTTVTGGIAISFGGPGTHMPSCDRCLRDRLGDRVVRAPNIVTVQNTRVEEIVAVDPNSGQPILVKHAESGAAAGGDGSFEHPFNSLVGLQGGSRPNDLLFLHGGSVFNGEQIALQAGQRLLGEGTVHVFNSQFGTFNIPKATGGAAPVIANSPGDAVTVANNTEVAGLTISGAGGTAIAGNGVINVRIDRNNIVGVSGNGIDLKNATGTTIAGNSVQAAGNGINLIDATGTTVIVDNSVQAAGNGISLIDATGTTVIAGNAVRAAGNGINANNATGTLYILDNMVNVGGGGINVDSSFGLLNVQIARNNVVGGTGVSVSANGTATINAQIAKNTIDATGFPDLSVNQNGFTSTLNIESANPGGGLFGGGLLGVVNLNTAASLSATTGGNLFLFPSGTFFTPP